MSACLQSVCGLAMSTINQLVSAAWLVRTGDGKLLRKTYVSRFLKHLKSYRRVHEPGEGD